MKITIMDADYSTKQYSIKEFQEQIRLGTSKANDIKSISNMLSGMLILVETLYDGGLISEEKAISVLEEFNRFDGTICYLSQS